MTRTSACRPFLFTVIAFGLAAVLSFPSYAAAQNAETEEEQVVVVNVHTESTTTSAGNQAVGIAGMSGAGSKRDFAVLEDLLGMLMAEFGGDPLIGALGASASGSLGDLKVALDEGGAPTTETMDYVIHIRPDEFRLKAQGFTMVWRSGKMSYTDPRTGSLTPIDLNMVNSNVAEGRIDHSGMEVTPMAGAQTKGVSGHLTRGYDYNYQMDMPLPGGMGLGSMGDGAAQVEVIGEAWIARGLPEAEQIATFYRNFASAFGDQNSMMGGQTAGMAKLAEIGVPLKTTETSSVYVMMPQENGDLAPLRVLQTVATTTVTDISTVPLSEVEEEAPPPDLEEPPAQTQVPGGQPPEPEPCDCSCDAFLALQDLDENDPEAMGKAMCARQCMAKWVGCAKP